METLSFKNLHMLKMYEEAFERGKDKTFAIYQRFDGKREKYSFYYIKDQADELIKRLEKAGLQKGDRIGVISVMRPWWFSLCYACLTKGYVMVCIDPGVPFPQIQKLLLDTEVRAVFTTLNKVNLPDALNESIPVFSIDKDFPLMSKCNKVSSWLDKPKRFPEDAFFVLFSSGTTSENRKAVLLKHSTVTEAIEYGMSNNTGVYKNKTPYAVRKRDLMLFPPYHIAGLLCATMDIYCNTEMIILERLTPNGLLSAFEELKPDNICSVPSMMNSLYKKILAGYSKKKIMKVAVNSLLSISSFLRRTFGIKAGRFLLKELNKKAFGGNMKGFMIGASPFEETANKFFLDMGIDVIMAYGLTELGAPLATTGQGYYPGTTGRVLRHTKDIDIRIANKDESGRGEVEVLSPYRMISYLNPKDNEGCFTSDGYFKTGDLGYFDKNDCLVICGRIKESIVLRNGEKLLPEEIEEKYRDVDCVTELVAFKVPGEGGCDDFSIAIIKNKEKAIPDAAMITRVYERAGHLPPMYSPKQVYVLKEFPLSSSHKIQRFRLTEMAVNGESEPKKDSLLIPIDEDETTTALRQMLVEVGGNQWATQQLSEGLLLNIDSLSIVNLYVMIQEKWDIDLFQSSIQPETFGQLLDVVKNFKSIDKKHKDEIDLSKYPLHVSDFGYFSARQLLKFIKMKWHVKGEGIENVPKDNGFIICSNHRTTLDPAFILSCLDKDIIKKTCTIGKSDIIKDKLLIKFVSTQNYIPVDRSGNAVKTLERSQELLEQGYNILIFPEGTNVINNTKLYPLKNGAVKLAQASNKQILPVHITGVAHFEGETSSFELPSTKGNIKVKFGKPFNPEGLTVEEANEILAKKIQELD